MSSNSTEPPLGERVVVAAVLGFFSIIGVFCYAVVCSVIFKHRKTDFSNSFYTLALGLAGGDMMHLLTVLLHNIPELLLGEGFFPYGVEAAMGFVNDAGFWTIAPIMVVICVNRYVAMFHYDVYESIFTKRSTVFLIICSYVIGICIPGIMYYCSCIYLFTDYTFGFACGDGHCVSFALTLNMILATSLVSLVALIYLVIFVRYRLYHQSSAAASKQAVANEKKLMIQFSLISSFLVIYLALFWFLALYYRHRYANFIQYLAATLNSFNNPFLYLMFSSEIRAKMPNPYRDTRVGQSSHSNM